MNFIRKEYREKAKRVNEQPPAEAKKEVVKKGKEIVEGIDELVDKIDDILEENAEEFVNKYIQKGGE